MRRVFVVRAGRRRRRQPRVALDMPAKAMQRLLALHKYRVAPEPTGITSLNKGGDGLVPKDSGAPNVRDDLFAGAGTLQILRDDSTMPFIIIVR